MHGAGGNNTMHGAGGNNPMVQGDIKADTGAIINFGAQVNIAGNINLGTEEYQVGIRPLGVAKPKRHETLESTWKTITDGRAIPLTRHLKKSDTWETHGRVRSDGQDHPKPVMKKSETTKEHSRALSPLPGSGKLLRKESSLGQDDLNRRVEAFIKKFNEETRMQRQESINQYMEMVNSGSH